MAYLENITFPPTRLDVVAETLRISHKLACECGDEYAIVSYDLAIAKPALQIQYAEQPQYDNVFVMFAAFHIEIAYQGHFVLLGYLLDGSGGPDILADTQVLAAGSLNGFNLGKHYNRY